MILLSHSRAYALGCLEFQIEPKLTEQIDRRRLGPIGMSEDKDTATAAAEQAAVAAGHPDGGVAEVEGVPPQIEVTPGVPVRRAVARRQARVRSILHTLPPAAQAAIRRDMDKTAKSSGADKPGRRVDPLGLI